MAVNILCLFLLTSGDPDHQCCGQRWPHPRTLLQLSAGPRDAEQSQFHHQKQPRWLKTLRCRGNTYFVRMNLFWSYLKPAVVWVLLEDVVEEYSGPSPDVKMSGHPLLLTPKLSEWEPNGFSCKSRSSLQGDILGIVSAKQMVLGLFSKYSDVVYGARFFLHPCPISPAEQAVFMTIFCYVFCLRQKNPSYGVSRLLRCTGWLQGNWVQPASDGGKSP